MRSEGLLARALGIALALAGWTLAGAQTTERTAVHGLQDLELFKTGGESWLLDRNDGEPAGAGRLKLWVVGDLYEGLTGVLVGQLAGGKAREPDDPTADVQQAFLRYVTPGRAPVTIDAGRVVTPFGNFSGRYDSNVNPLIGDPDAYSVAYPYGVVLTGKAARFDYRGAVVDQPFTNPKYVPKADRAWRPTLEVGVTPLIGLRLGAFGTHGSYLGSSVASSLPAGQDWKDYVQTIAGANLAFAHGYFELNGEYTYSTYEVPTRTALSRGRAWFIEPKYTWTPRLFTALRLEHNDYPFIMPISTTFWLGDNASFYDIEIGAGWRFTSGLILKASYRRDRWGQPAIASDGYAIGLQLSYAFDVKSWFEPR